MIELVHNQLVFSFPEVHPGARVHVDMQRTLRIPDDGRSRPLPPGLGRFPLRHIDDFADAAPSRWLDDGGVMLPIHESEALWLHFDPAYVVPHQARYPFAIKVASGKIDTLSGERYTTTLGRDPQDYLVAPEQPWLDGYLVERGIVRQFLAVALADGTSAEEQLAGTAEHGGLELVVRPMKREAFERHFPKSRMLDALHRLLGRPTPGPVPRRFGASAGLDMGLGGGGRMRQRVRADPYDPQDWSDDVVGGCFVHLANSIVWRATTGEAPPTVPPTAATYNRAKLPWFEDYQDGTPLDAAERLRRQLRSVAEIARAQRRPVKGAAEGTVREAPPEGERVVQLRRPRPGGRMRETKP